MNLRYLGDALDYWKGALFQRLENAKFENAKLIHNLKVDPMATDPEEWRPEDFSLYADLLCIERERILEHQVPLTRERHDYFREIEHKEDLFLDPDIGVATGRFTPKHIRTTEICCLLGERSDRVLIVYQHIRGRKTRERIEEIESALRCAIGSFSCCSYESGTVAMMFLSKESHRVNCIYQHFKDLLGKRAMCRVHRW